MTAPFSTMSHGDAQRFMRTKERQRIREVIAERVGDGTVIDLGCGRGIDVARLYDKDRYIGVDCSSELVELAKQDNPGFLFFRDDIREDGFWSGWSGKLDFAVLKSVLEHQESLEDAQGIYQNALNVARTVLVGWHTPPIYHRTEIIRVQAVDLEEPLYQNHYIGGAFEREDVQVDIERVDEFTLWTAKRL